MEIPLPAPLRFHSLFACPVSKEHATPENPPMMLTCGHAIARESFAKLGKGSCVLKLFLELATCQGGWAMADQLGERTACIG